MIDNVYIEYCIDGYNLIKRKIVDLCAQLNEIRREVDGIFNAPFCVDDYQNRGLLVVENSNFADLIFFLKLVYLIWRFYLPIQNVN